MDMMFENEEHRKYFHEVRGETNEYFNMIPNNSERLFTLGDAEVGASLTPAASPIDRQP